MKKSVVKPEEKKAKPLIKKHGIYRQRKSQSMQLILAAADRKSDEYETDIKKLLDNGTIMPGDLLYYYERQDMIFNEIVRMAIYTGLPGDIV